MHAATAYVDPYLLVVSNDNRQNHLFKGKYREKLEQCVKEIYDLREHLCDLNDDVYINDGTGGFSGNPIGQLFREDNITVVLNLRGFEPDILQAAALVTTVMSQKK